MRSKVLTSGDCTQTADIRQKLKPAGRSSVTRAMWLHWDWSGYTSLHQLRIRSAKYHLPPSPAEDSLSLTSAMVQGGGVKAFCRNETSLCHFIPNFFILQGFSYRGYNPSLAARERSDCLSHPVPATPVCCHLLVWACPALSGPLRWWGCDQAPVGHPHTARR